MSQQVIIGGRYEVGELLGEGGMGAVYRGVDTQTGTPVAVKILKPEVATHSPEQVERFRREAEAVYQLDHPNIVKVFGAFVYEGVYCIVMEYMGGGSLRAMLKRDKRLPIFYTLNLALDLCDALTRTHRLKIVHRDIKPDNVLLSDDSVPHLTDFGQAHIADAESLTRVGQVIGTPHYIAPEILLGHPIDPRADIWSFGVMLYEMVSGFQPFMADNNADLMMAILKQPVPDLKKLRPDCPPKLAQLVTLMLAKDREARIFSVREVGAHIEQILLDIESGADTGGI
jgi:serine/threonine protein kinase